MNAVVGTLVRILAPGGIGEAVGGLLDAAGHEHRRVALEIWAAELSDHPDVTAEQIASDPKLFATFTVANVIQRAQTHDRISLFARLHANFLRGTGVQTPDDFKEFVRLLDDLSEREFQMLVMLDEWSKKFAHFEYEFSGDHSVRRPPVDLHRARLLYCPNYWWLFHDEAVKRFGLSKDEVANIVQGLPRTGLCQLQLDLAGTVAGAVTTPYFERFTAALRKYDRNGQPLEKTISIKPLV
ncbi:MAG TPA: hypothetical protein VGQ75_10200 [Thermoanaerobaculia bacterium]|nr:hypothetical protein [Thermoanaerobaculia bacterium]